VSYVSLNACWDFGSAVEPTPTQDGIPTFTGFA